VRVTDSIAWPLNGLAVGMVAISAWAHWIPALAASGAFVFLTILRLSWIDVVRAENAPVGQRIAHRPPKAKVSVRLRPGAERPAASAAEQKG
jgi:hypothetical protein